MKTLLLPFILLFTLSTSFAQVVLGPSPYAQDFNSIGSGLPVGITVRAGSTASALGTAQSFSTALIAWNNTTGAPKNFASGSDLPATATSTVQNASANRSLGIRQTGTLGDPGAAFVLQLANTTGLNTFKLTFKLQSLDITSPRITTWRVDYGFGPAPSVFTAAAATGTLTTGGSAFTSNAVAVDFGTSLDNRPDDVWIRIVAITPSTGSGNRASSAIDDLSLSYSSGTVVTPSFSVSPSSITFGNQAIGTNSNSQSYALNYANLDGSSVSVSTTSPFSLSKSAAGPFSSSLTYTSAELTGSSTTVFAQFSPTSVGSANAVITHTGGGVSGSTTVSLGGNGVNLTPSAVNDLFSGSFGSLISGNVSSNDSDPQSLGLTYTKITDPQDGTLNFNSDGTFSYQSVEGSAAVQTFSYRVTNTLNLSADASVTINLVEKSKIFISQYYEGTSVNKWIELTNPTGVAVNTTSPQLKLGLYGISGDAGNIVIAGSPTQIVNLNITIPAKSSVLIGNTGNGVEVPYLTASSAQQSSNAVINFNGNDGVALLDAANNIVDAFGSGVNAKDVSYVRNQDATVPSLSFIAADWTRTLLAIVQNAADLDDPNRLGVHVQPELPPCVTPTNQPSSLSFSSVGTKSITLNFTASSDAGEYLIVRSVNSMLTDFPADGTIYNAGNPLGGGTVAAQIAGTSFTDNNVLPGTTYYYFIFALNNISCDGGPKYLNSSPLSGTQATEPLPVCFTPISQPSNFRITFSNYNVIQGAFDAASADEFLVVMSKDSTLSSLPVNQVVFAIGDSIGGGIVIKKGSQATFSRSGLAQDTEYFFFIFSFNSNCSGGPLYLTTAPLTGKQKTAVLNSSTLNYYYGNLHSHSSYSDGNKDDLSKKPEDDYAFAKNSRKMDFLGISEHNHTQAGMRLANWQPGIQAAKNATTPNFVAMHGMEWGVISGGGHVVVYGIDSLIGWESGEYQIFVQKSTYTGPTGLFNVINRHGLNAIATLAHPNTTDFNNLASHYDPLADSAVVGSALESGPAFSTNLTYSDLPSSMSYLTYYNLMLSRGYHLGANMDHDNHNMTFGRHTRGRLVVLAPALSENDLLDAMKKMRFYASEDSAARISYTINDRIIGSVFAGNGMPHISVSGSTTSPMTNITIMHGLPGSGILPTALASSSTGTLSYSDSTLMHLSTGYYYADITEADGSRIITSPIWYTRNDSIKSEQTITFNALPSITYGDPDIDPSATSTNLTIPINYTSSDTTVASIVAGKVHIRNAGSVTITASQPGNSLYKPAAPKSQTLLIMPKAVTAFADAKSKVYGSSDPELTYSVSPALVNDDAFTGALTRDAGENTGTYIISQGTLALSSNYVLTVDTALFAITRKDLVVTADDKSKIYGANIPVLSAHYDGFVNGDSSSVFTTPVVLSTVAIDTSSVGTYPITASGATATNYSISFVPGTLTITPADATMTLNDLSQTFDGNPKSVTVTTTPANLSGITITYNDSTTAPSAVGSYSVVAHLSNLNYTADDVSGTLVINKIQQVISFAALTDKTYGDADFALNATGGGSGNPIIYVSTDTAVATISGSTVHIKGAGPTTITASQSGSDSYSAATPVVQSLTVNKAIATITLSNLSQLYDGTAKSVVVTTTPSGLSGITVTYNGSTSAPSAPGSYVVVASLNNINYSATPVSNTFTITPTLKVQYRNADSSVADNTGKPYVKIINNSTVGIPYNQLTARYWITPENFTGSLGLWIDYAQMGNNKVSMRYVTLASPRVKAFGYIEYSFSSAAGTLLPNGNSGEIQSRFSNSDWSAFNESNDYSMQTNTTYADNSQITLYHNGTLIWGTEPTLDTPAVSFKAFSEAKNSGNSTINTIVEIRNDGNVPVDFRDVTARYWFTTEGSSPLNFTVDYVKMGTTAVTGSFTGVSPAQPTANAYLELKMNPVANTFYPSGATGNIQYRITKSDHSSFNQSNDYSYQNGTLAENQRITVYHKGQLVYGTEPIGRSSSSARASTPEVSEIQTEPVVYPNPSNGNFALVMNGDRGPVKIAIYNVVGQVVDTYTAEKTGSFRKDYDLKLSPGIYLMMITSKDHTDQLHISIK